MYDYVYILNGQKLIKNAKKWSILASFWTPEACGQTVLPIWLDKKLMENAENEKLDKPEFSPNFSS